MSIYINGCRKVNDIYINANGKKKVNSCWVNKNGNPTKVFQLNSNIVNGVKIVSWADGTYEEIADMLDGHYSGKINIQDYWNVGDERMIDMSYINSINLEYQGAGVRPFVILGFNHDNLNTGGKAAVSVSMKTPFTTHGKMSKNEPTSGYGSALRSTWCNSNFKNSLPTNLQSLIKPVKKKTFVNYKTSNANSIITLENYCWLLSGTEIAGTIGKVVHDGDEGIQYPYFDLGKDNIFKGTTYWTRTSCVNYSDYFQFVKSSFSSWWDVFSNSSYDTTLGILVGFCI